MAMSYERTNESVNKLWEQILKLWSWYLVLFLYVMWVSVQYDFKTAIYIVVLSRLGASLGILGPVHWLCYGVAIAKSKNNLVLKNDWIK